MRVVLPLIAVAWRGPVHLPIAGRGRHSAPRAEASESFDDSFSSDMMSALARRMAEMSANENDRRVESMVVAASNWRTGGCAQRIITTLDEWVRRIHRVDGVLACGTYSGDVFVIDLESGETLDRWTTDDPEEPEITSIGFSDSEHVSSGDANGNVYFRRRGEAAPVLCASSEGPLQAHSGPVSGVHWDGGPLAYSCSFDSKLICYDVSVALRHRWHWWHWVPLACHA